MKGRHITPIANQLWLMSLQVSALLGVLLSAGLAHGAQSSGDLTEFGQVSVGMQYDTESDFSGIEGLTVQRIQTTSNLPFFFRQASAGRWSFALNIAENRLALGGTTSRRFYRFSLPLLYIPRSRGRWSYTWFLDPSHYSDESIIANTRNVMEGAFLAKYRANRKLKWVAGVKRDNRFGGTAWTPVFGMDVNANKRMRHHWVFPDIYSQLQLNKKTSVRLYMQPNGSQWLYDLGDGSKATFILSDWNGGLAVRQKGKMPFNFVFKAGMNFMGKATVGTSEGDLDTRYFFSVGIESVLP